jgi:hypothetical protein
LASENIDKMTRAYQWTNIPPLFRPSRMKL